ncbi:MBL fold metallo-hydrolase [Nocardia cyriacigeorgica]|uniref:MBL fold metallo-hydrolase n=1 Tax=Nocardia cyriacigeorgica TaxID=135487 RepID=UPI001895A24D|nr:MBL fold metallo-hydrolase [Nocardia cyriacigeorgica]MBF6086647.1 MBL fold metallo-hydrolase [Nocardia cyriacigeorgica]MBF6091040.1 MBL fold metallo-hydrolase [Nocardia cyriacigeorgica]MBF6395343.1 MBL fold metallo-hydrolase [Nocardia cyriacigeorgica]MBF6400975.1 MBL fold metallo-hydrolase [Nocardia cyriacigeorgica]
MTRVERIVTSGQFCLDGGCWDVDNNIWLVGDDTEVLIIDAAHDARPILDAVAGRRVTAIVCTHAHNDHVTVAPQLSAATGAPIYLHPADDVLWQQTHPGLEYTALGDGQRLEAGTAQLEVLHTPGHSPGSCCLHLPELGELFSGDTLFEGGPGATGRSYSDYPTILASINDRLFALPDATVVHTGHGPDTTLGAERANVPASAGTES